MNTLIKIVARLTVCAVAVGSFGMGVSQAQTTSPSRRLPTTLVPVRAISSVEAPQRSVRLADQKLRQNSFVRILDEKGTVADAVTVVPAVNPPPYFIAASGVDRKLPVLGRGPLNGGPTLTDLGRYDR
jgi:hypothetical protein